jgi:hypothetical protein
MSAWHEAWRESVWRSIAGEDYVRRNPGTLLMAR